MTLAATTLAILTLPSAAGINKRQTQRPAESPLSQPAGANLSRDYGKLPLAFEPNLGQTDARVRFLARGGGMTTFFTDIETVMVLGRGERAVVRMKLAGASQPRRAIGLEKLPGIGNYFIGNDPAKWRTGVPHFARIQYEGVYPGIDVAWYGNQRRLEYDFIVAPGADPSQIQVACEGVESLSVDTGGELVLRTAVGEVRQQKPRVYQEIGKKQVEVRARYAILAHNRVGFQLGKYDRKRQLRIDPVVLVYSTYLGGGYEDWGVGIAVDGTGSAYVTGSTNSTNFPTQSPYQATVRSGYDAFVTKLASPGNALVYSTYLGGSGDDNGNGIAVDGAGSAYISGTTGSANFPTQSPYQAAKEGPFDAFVAKLTPAGNMLVYSTYLGGSGEDYGRGIAVDGAGSAYVTGFTSSSNFPTQSAHQATYQDGYYDAFVTKLTPAGSALAYSTYLGGYARDEGWGIAVDGAGSAYVTGVTYSSNFPTQSAYQATYQGGQTDAFVTKLAPAGNALVYSSYLGGSLYDWGYGIAVDGAGSAYVTGRTSSINFPTQSPYQATFQGAYSDAFVTKLTPAGSGLVYSTYLGGSGWDHGLAITVDGTGSAYVTGETDSTNFPSQSAYQATLQGMSDAFVAKLTAAGNALVYSTYLGGGNDEVGRGIAVDGAGSAYVTGTTYSTNFPTQWAYQQIYQGRVFDGDAFVTRLSSLGVSLGISKTHVGNFAQGQSGATYAVTVWNAGSAGTTGTVTVTDNLPPGLTLVSMAGTGWTCPANACTRSNALSPGSGYSPITVTVNVAANAPPQVTNQVSVSGGGSATANAADTATVTLWISGQVTKGGLPLPGATVLLAGGTSGTRVTDASGNYSFTALASGGNYTVTPTLSNHIFTPSSAAFNNLQTNRTANFIAQAVISPLGVLSVAPAAGVTATQAFTFSFTDPDGWQDLGVVNVLMNFWLDGRNSCYLAYSRPANTLYLINNAGDGYAGSMTMNGSGTLSNSQCLISGAGSSVSGAGNTMTLTLNMTFPASFAGAKVVYMAARDMAETNSGWQRMGVWKVPGAAQTTTTAVAGMNPARGSGTGGTFTYTFTDTNGANNLGVMNILVNDWLEGRHACYLAYARANNTLYLMNDNGDGLLPEKVLNGSGSLGNSQCAVNGVGSSARLSGDTLTLTLNMVFAAGFAGNRVFYLAARDVNEQNNTGWQPMGSWTVP